MLSRIWGRTHLRSTARDIPFLPYSPFGDLDRISPLPETGQTVWVLESTQREDLQILLGFAVLNGLKVRLHGISNSIPTLAYAPDPELSKRKPDMRKELLLRTERMNLLLDQWRQSSTRWRTALETLQGIPFGSMNSLEVLQIILQGLPKANLQLFRRVDTSAFAWNEEEFRMIETFLAEMRSKTMPDPWEWHFDQMRLNGERLYEVDPEDCAADIHQVMSDLESLKAVVQYLGRLLAHAYSCREDAADWATVQGAVGRATLLTLPEEAHIQAEGLHLQHLIDAFSSTLIAHGWFRDWFGFQFISFEEMEQEIDHLHNRLVLLKAHLREIRQVAVDRHLHRELPAQIRALLQVQSGHRQAEVVAAFPIWYLSRWLEKRTPPAAWNILTAYESRRQQRAELQLAAQELMDIQLLQASWLDRIHTIREGDTRSAPDSDPAGWIDVYWNALPPAGESYIQLAHQGSVATGPELTRLVYLMDHLPESSRLDLPSPLHKSPKFWDPAHAETGMNILQWNPSPVAFAH